MIKLSFFRANGIYLLYAFTIFLSAFLIFQIQPMLGKYMLPSFGGTSAVWALSLLFFTSALFFGYLYAYLLSKLSYTKQVAVHGSLLLLTTATVIFSIASRSQLGIGLEEISRRNIDPSWMVLITLSLSIGLPYLMLASSSPLFQQFYTVSQKKEPYKLYAISNAGSFLALLTYPFLVEPFFNLRTQQLIWALLFILFFVLCLIGLINFIKASSLSSDTPNPDQQTKLRQKVPWKAWLGYAILPAFVLVASTTFITQKISPIPLLWILPLALYLASFIIAFSGLGSLKSHLFLMTLAISAGLYAVFSAKGAIAIILATSMFLIITSTFCHSKLYSLRPGKEQSSLFYVFTSAGGAIGALLGSIVPPLIFTDLIEIEIAILASALVSITVFYSTEEIEKSKVVSVLKYPVTAILLIGIIATSIPIQAKSVLFSQRNFYGTHTVIESEKLTSYLNNGVIHGSQFRDEPRRFEPTAYYYDGTGLYQAIEKATEVRDDQPVNIGVVGLGAGSTAHYCQNDNVNMEFYEIDSLVEKIAEDYFTFLENCQNVEVKIGDGRIILAQELADNNPGKFDVLVLDAFSGGTVPTHLLTLEALQIYTKHLTNDDSIIAFHISNKWIDLSKPLAKLALENDMSSARVDTIADTELNRAIFNSSYMLLSKNPEFLDSGNLVGYAEIGKVEKTPLWTDNHTNILSALEL